MKRLILYGVICFQIALIVSLARGMQLSLRSKERIVGLQDTKEKLTQEQNDLKQNQEYVQSPYYLEKVAREELHLAKPGETVVIVPEGRLVVEPVASSPAKQEEKSNLQQWWDVLSGKID